jgi:hypothetical protein
MGFLWSHAEEFLHVRLPTWFPLTIQIYVNGHEWLARQLDRQHVDYQRRDNAFLFLADPAQTQQRADQLLRKKWPPGSWLRGGGSGDFVRRASWRSSRFAFRSRP